MSKLALITALFPPPHPDPAQHAWQRAVSVYVMAIGGVLVATYVMLIWGLIPVVFSGFATAADMQLVKAQQSQMQEQARADKNELKVAILAGNIALVYDRMCAALRAVPRRQEEADVWANQLDRLLIDYQRANGGQAYPVRGCT